MLPGARRASHDGWLVGCVTENSPKYLAQTLRLVRSIRWFGGSLAEARVMVCAVDGIDADARRLLERDAAEVRVVPRLDPRNPPTNRFRFFEQAWEDPSVEHLLALDCDTLVVRDPLPLLRRDVFQAKIAPIASVPHDAMERVFGYCGVDLPARDYVTAIRSTPTIAYCNVGVLAMPASLSRSLIPLWADFNLRLLERLDLLGTSAHHCHQAALSLALAAGSIPFVAAPEELNLQLNMTAFDAPHWFRVDPAILHYHDRVEPDGSLSTTPYPLAQVHIEAFNRRQRLGSASWQNMDRRQVAATIPASRRPLDVAPVPVSPAAAPPAQVFVLGMHRSGTSALARLLERLGLYAGGELDFAEPDEANPRGYWERRDVWALNESTLRSLGSGWNLPIGLDLASMPDAVRAWFAERAAKIVGRLDAEGPWVAKDPRSCLLFPLWRPLLRNPVAILIHRDPLAVARSLAARDGTPLGVGIALWEHYNRAALAATLGVPRCLVSFSELLADPVATARRLSAELSRFGVSLPAFAATEREIAASIDPAGERQRSDADLESEMLFPAQAELRRVLADGSALALDPVPPLSAGAGDLLRSAAAEAAFERRRLARLTLDTEQAMALHARVARDAELLESMHRRVADDAALIESLHRHVAVDAERIEALERRLVVDSETIAALERSGRPVRLAVNALRRLRRLWRPARTL